MLTKKPVLADSKEVLKDYQLGKLKLLEKELNRLNLLEHPREIEIICKKIIMIKERLAK